VKQEKITHLITNPPYAEPTHFWRYHRETRNFTLDEGRRPAGYVIATVGGRSFDDPGVFVEIPLVNQIRPRVRAWRESGYVGTTGITQRLLAHWNDAEEREGRRFFFCQLEAIETLIWILEAPDAEKVGIDIPGDGGAFNRVCSKMATGTGKTLVMSMLIAWHVLNKVSYPQDARFSKSVFVVAPGLTVKNRLQVLDPFRPENYYEEFNIVPLGLREMLRQGRVVIRNWHALNWDTEEQVKKRRSVDKRGTKSDEAYAREVLAELASATNLLVINDEAHHAWRVPAEFKGRSVDRELFDEATKWVGGLDRIQRARGILACYDFSATPFAPSGKQSSEEALFGWIVSDFGLNDAIESGLVKTPRVVIRDDGKFAKDYKSRFYHLYMDDEVKDDINRPAQEHVPLPQLVTNAYYLLGKDWLETANLWATQGFKTPPVMISVANRTETAARIKYSFDRHKILIDELCDPARTLHIDSKVLNEAEAKEEGAISSNRELTKKEQAEFLRRTVDTVGRIGEPGEQIQNVISVGMLSEGWDAKTVTHILGLRAFSSQLLCEQVVGRGLRRTSYEVNSETGFFEPEYVNIFGVPFSFLPHEEPGGTPPPPPPPKTRIEPVKEKGSFAIRWPNVIRIDHVYKPELTLDLGSVPALRLDASNTAKLAELAPVVDGKPDFTKIAAIDLDELGKRFRMQKIAFEAARDIFEQMQPSWKGSREFLLAQVITLVERFLASPKIEIDPPLFYQDQLKRRILLTLSMQKIVQHVFERIRYENTQSLSPVFDTNKPIRSTNDMLPWYSGKPCEAAAKCHINFVILDSTWEGQTAFELDHNPAVEAWVKNDHLGFEIVYSFQGVIHKYRPDFLVRLKSGTQLILEIKGQQTDESNAKQTFLGEWVDAVNQHGGFGNWKAAVSFTGADVSDILESCA
jgi:type III restriction enzyme